MIKLSTDQKYKKVSNENNSWASGDAEKVCCIISGLSLYNLLAMKSS